MTALKIDKIFYLIINLKSNTGCVSEGKAKVPREVNKTNIKFGRNKGIMLKEIIIVGWNRELKKKQEQMWRLTTF
jgi:hypothetical protein